MALPSKKLRIIIAILLIITGIGVFWALHHGQESTDDAQIDSTIVTISPKIAGYVKALHVEDNAMIKKGDVILEIDPTDFALRRDRANALLESAKAQEAIAEARHDQAKKDFDRVNALGKLASSPQQLDEVSTANKTTEAALSDAVARLLQAQADFAQAENDLNHTKIIAPIDGRVTQKGVQQGNYIQPGQQLLYLVSPDMWVNANFKETQLTDMRVGQSVDITIDTLPDHHFTGKIESFQAGTGARFSTFPAENATGNFVKIVQRIPVKIHFDTMPDKNLPIGPGMSVIATVKTH